MLKKYLDQRHTDRDSGRSCLAVEREYWQALEVLAYEDGWNSKNAGFWIDGIDVISEVQVSECRVFKISFIPCQISVRSNS